MVNDMKLILDTHVFLWSLGEFSVRSASEFGNLSNKQRSEIEACSNTVYISSISIAEMMIKSSIGKLDF